MGGWGRLEELQFLRKRANSAGGKGRGKGGIQEWALGSEKEKTLLMESKGRIASL